MTEALSLTCSDASAQLRIGSVSTLSGVPVSTLRIWQTRYAAFSPSKTTGQHRLYTQADADKAALLRHLTENGHSIGGIARLDMPTLQRMAQHPLSPAARHSRPAHLDNEPGESLPVVLDAAQAPSIAVVGSGLVQRLQSAGFMRHAWEMRLSVVAEFADLAQAWENVAVVGQASQADNQTKAASQPALWLMRLNTLDDAACAQLASVRAAHPQTACVLLYSYGPQTVVQALRRMGCVVRREPLQDDELAELIQAVLTRAQTAGTDAKRIKGSAPDAAPVPPRKYADHTLQRVASLSGTIQCECPRHVAELIAQLANFEQYSQACLNKSPDDARLHAHLHRVSGTARALFEQALEMVARHEGIDLA